MPDRSLLVAFSALFRLSVFAGGALAVGLAVIVAVGAMIGLAGLVEDLRGVLP